MIGKVTKDTPHGYVEMRGSEDALAYAMTAITQRDELAAALKRIAEYEWRTNKSGSVPAFEMETVRMIARTAHAKVLP